jgi:hypothetical protein
LTDDTIKNLGFYSGNATEVERILGFDAGPGLVILYPCYGGADSFCRVKPDATPIIGNRPAKYLSPKGAPVRAYIPPRTAEALKDPKMQIIITEGEKKAARADQEGFPCIGLGGVWGFSQNHQLISDLAELRWKGREVYVAPDSDFATNPDVKSAVFTLERSLIVLGALVR